VVEEHIKTKIRNINLSASHDLGQENFFFQRREGWKCIMQSGTRRDEGNFVCKSATKSLRASVMVFRKSLLFIPAFKVPVTLI
jgi:hypothetical protein